ncbi:hypothetical protein F4859DRAFT_492425 [Xylaria cf. heliscus]|nr:hypothetical protein F4859DRAFT_492425 [Xylaria cf. heliscus]
MELQSVIYSVLSSIILGISALLIAVGGGLETTDLDCVESMSSWSPASEALHHEWRTFQNDFKETSPYRGEPSVTLEALWNSSLPEAPIKFSHQNLAQLKDEPSNFATDQSGGGSLGHLEIFRNLACLNLLRQHTYREDYNYSYLEAFNGPESSIMAKVDGCVQRLRQVLMCSGDTTPYLIVLTPERKQKESPDFNTLHYCRDFDSILSWTLKHVSETSADLPALYTLTDELL